MATRDNDTFLAAEDTGRHERGHCSARSQLSFEPSASSTRLRRLRTPWTHRFASCGLDRLFNLITYQTIRAWQSPDNPIAPDQSYDVAQEFYTGGLSRLLKAQRGFNLRYGISVTTSWSMYARSDSSQKECTSSRTQTARRASIAFSFDWESAMGGPVHSQGMTVHDVAGRPSTVC